MKTRLTTLLGIRWPVIQGGLAYLARAELAAAVTEAGGLGQITATTLPTPEAVREEIKRFRTLSRGPVAVNLAMGHRPIEPLLEAALEQGIGIISLTGGNPEPYVDRIKSAGARLMVLVAGVRAAVKAESLGADVVIAVGVEGGGHLGRDDVGTMVLTRRIVESLSVPVVASGGIADGAGLVAALALGAEGIEMGTRFVATRESPAHAHYKAALVASDIQDTRIIERSIGRPGRTLPSSHVERILALEETRPARDVLLPWIAGEVNCKSAIEGQLDSGFVWAGQAQGLIRDIPTVKDLMARIMGEADAARKKLVSTWE